MNLPKSLKKLLDKPTTPYQYPSSPHHDFSFTSNFHAKAKEHGLTAEHAKLVYYEGDQVKGKGKENMKVLSRSGQEIGIYVFHDRMTNQPVITSIWKRRQS